MAVTYDQIVQYLDAIADNANLSVDNSPHGRFWKDGNGNQLPLEQFKSLVVPGVSCNGNPVSAFDPVHPEQSPLYLILIGPWCNKPQMPKGGPPITGGNSVPVGGINVAGQQIQSDFLAWLIQTFPPAGAGTP